MPKLSMPCDLCDGKTGEYVLEKDGLAMARCSSDGLVYTDPQPPRDELQRYSDAKFSMPDTFLAFPSEARRAARDTLGLLKRLTGGGRLLDVGCGVGMHLTLASEFGFEAAGCERSPDLAAYAAAQGSHIFCGDFLDFPARIDDATWDAIIMSEVIEHFPSPRIAVRKAHKLLRDGGVLYLTTPDVSSWLARLQRERWVHIHPADHIYLFSPVTIRILLESECFGVESIQRANFKAAFCARGGPSLEASGTPPAGVRLVLGLPRPLRAAARPVLRKLNLGSNMTVIARSL